MLFECWHTIKDVLAGAVKMELEGRQRDLDGRLSHKTARPFPIRGNGVRGIAL
jgi:hypothetical protein